MVDTLANHSRKIETAHFLSPPLLYRDYMGGDFFRSPFNCDFHGFPPLMRHPGLARSGVVLGPLGLQQREPHFRQLANQLRIGASDKAVILPQRKDAIGQFIWERHRRALHVCQ